MKIDDDVLKSFKERYKHIDPLIFHRSVERADSPGHLFDVLETIPDKFPLIWDEAKRCWSWTTDISQVSRFELFKKQQDD